MLLFDATHTSHTRAQTGIQRVCRSLYESLKKHAEITAICCDPHLAAWRTLQRDEQEVLTDRTGGAGRSRGARWTLAQKLGGRVRRLLSQVPHLPHSHALICPELFTAATGARLKDLLSQVSGPRVAIFHDAIGLRFPELTPPATVSRLPAYLRELLLFDGIAAVSEDSAASLRDYWAWLGVSNPPPVRAILLGLDPIPAAPTAIPTGRPRVLCVSTIEGRKNHLALLQAAEQLWSENIVFELELVGLARPESAALALVHIDQLKNKGRPLIFRGSVSEADLHAAYARATFTVYPSLAEGFGLPVLESLQHGRPCVCSNQGALGESATPGGCVALPRCDANSLANTMRILLQKPAELAALTAAARTRHFRQWSDYSAELLGWMKSLPRRT